MSLFHNTRIVTDGLVLCLDAANTKSYPGSGTTWTDLTNRNNGTLINGPTFNSVNNGYIAFDGTNDYLEFTNRNTNLEFQPTQAFSAFCWIYNPTWKNYSAVFANMIDSSPYTGYDLWFESSSQISMHLISSWSLNAIKVGINFDYASYSNKWVNVGYTYNGTCPSNATDQLNSVNFYINGALNTGGKVSLNGTDGFNSSNETITYNSSQRFRLASRWLADTQSSVCAVSLSNIQIYNRALTATEISQNYNALKGRFGL